ncbi:hypothetical protein N7G274_001751 [Stereocaulon virgatum]|uniref:Uncharacterized protein n=1 Tax=Stereocaulon virgatum TaxID=373712 RepID=A0ABR4AKK9_9LECA
MPIQHALELQPTQSSNSVRHCQILPAFYSSSKLKRFTLSRSSVTMQQCLTYIHTAPQTHTHIPLPPPSYIFPKEPASIHSARTKFPFAPPPFPSPHQNLNSIL